MTGKKLRFKVSNFQDVLTDVKWFIEKGNKLTPPLEELIEKISDECDDLFYLIPLEEEKIE